jgi:nicotinamide riboside kinase
MIRIAFVGSHSTGKSTLVDYCKQQLMDRLHTIENIPRRIIAKGFPMGPYAVVDSFANYVRDQLQAERKSAAAATGDKDWLISNRTILDAVAYAGANRELPRPFIADYFIEMLEEIARVEATFYDLYVEFPVCFPMTADAVRPEGEDYRKRVGQEISRLLGVFNVSHVSLTGTTDERFRSLIEHVGGLGKV